MTTKNTTKFGTDLPTTGTTNLTVYSSGQALSRKEVNKTAAELERQALAIRGEQYKEHLAAEAIASIRDHSIHVFRRLPGINLWLCGLFLPSSSLYPSTAQARFALQSKVRNGSLNWS